MEGKCASSYRSGSVVNPFPEKKIFYTDPVHYIYIYVYCKVMRWDLICEFYTLHVGASSFCCRIVVCHKELGTCGWRIVVLDGGFIFLEEYVCSH